MEPVPASSDAATRDTFRLPLWSDLRFHSREFHIAVEDSSSIIVPTSLSTGGSMATTRNSVLLTLTPEQKRQVKVATGKDAETLELDVEEIENRIAPMKKYVLR
jgi:hypothetical protein